ncbi:MAG: HAMP domain-containing sensor histidine kinase [Butyribacter sp.]|nr:HAMP domain-containing sensor histidine kinase [bacterium]MDY3854330.1 HAMP domain-containing sensor histidine kinase [Butyribacter sp.]
MTGKKRSMKKNYTVNAFQSIRTKMILIMILLMGFVSFGLWFMNYMWLSPFYENSKSSQLADSFLNVNKVISKDDEYIDENAELSSDSQLKLEILEENSSVNLYVFRVADYFGNLVYNFDYPRVSDVQKQTIEDLTESYLYTFGQEGNLQNKIGEGRKLIRERKKYRIFKVYDKRIGSYYLELFGQLESGSFVYLRTNYQSMNENIDIFNHFIIQTASIVLVIGVLLMSFFGNRFTKPILQITDIAKRMSELDFDAKYEGTTQDEIGVLGSSINVLSEKLETTISELKTANNELQKDIENKIQIDEMRKEFLSNVSHELKTPIALIQGYAEGLQDNINDDASSREFYCEVIIDEAQKMNKMVKKLLTLNQIEFGNNQVSFERFDIVELVQTVMQSATLLAEQKAATLTMDKEYAPLYVWADEYMVEEVITNYISNAINHVDFERKIIVSMEEKESVVRITVFNTGQQIPQEEIDKIWIKFYKVDKARTREYGGSGIGLSIVKAIMDSMNRECGVENCEDGVKFWFELDRQN